MVAFRQDCQQDGDEVGEIYSKNALRQERLIKERVITVERQSQHKAAEHKKEDHGFMSGD
jgi:hypothetical protein